MSTNKHLVDGKYTDEARESVEEARVATVEANSKYNDAVTKVKDIEKQISTTSDKAMRDLLQVDLAESGKVRDEAYYANITAKTEHSNAVAQFGNVSL